MIDERDNRFAMEHFALKNVFRKSSEGVTLEPQRPAHDTLHMSSDAAHTVMTDANGDIATHASPTSLTDAGETFPGLPDHLVVSHIFRSEYFDDPADLARLPAVSRAMRDTVAATGLEFKELNEYEYVHLGCISAMERLLRQDHLRSEDHLCGAAARSGQLEMLQWLRANDCPWDIETCTSAAVHGHFEVLQWLRANGCPWDASTYGMATRQGHLDILQWARATAARGAGKRSCTRKVYIPSCITGQ